MVKRRSPTCKLTMVLGGGADNVDDILNILDDGRRLTRMKDRNMDGRGGARGVVNFVPRCPGHRSLRRCSWH